MRTNNAHSGQGTPSAGMPKRFI